MQAEELHNFLFELYDYADYLADQITPDNDRNSAYFLNLVYIEKLFDTLGRGKIYDAAKEMGETDPGKSLSEAHRRIDKLRERIAGFVEQYDFDRALDIEATKMQLDWHKRKNR